MKLYSLIAHSSMFNQDPPKGKEPNSGKASGVDEITAKIQLEENGTHYLHVIIEK